MIPAFALLTLLACPKTPAETPVTAADPLARRPEVPELGEFVPGVPARFTLSNGVEVWLDERPGLPLVSVRLVVDGGSASDPATRHGLTSLSDTLITHGAGERDAAAFAALLERQAISLSVSTGPSASVVALDTHADRLDQALGLMADAVLRPRFDAEAVARVKDITLGELEQALDEPGTLAVWAGLGTWWGAAHPLGHGVQGRKEAVQAVTAAEVRASWAQRYTAANAHIVVAGAVEQEALRGQLERHLGAWAGARYSLTIPARVAPAAGPQRVMVHNPGASQSILRVMLPGWAASDEALLPARLGVIVLGGTFTSRLNRLLREEKGYTYGAKAWVDPGPGWGTVVAQSSVIQSATAPALQDLLGQLELLAAQGIRPEELDKAQGARRTAVVSALESRAAIASTLASLEQGGQPADALRAELERLPQVTVEQVNSALGRLTLDQAVVVVVGDLEVIRGPLQEAVPGEWTEVKF